LFAQRSLARAESCVEKSMERLASGLRINRAADDPAGLAMATSMSAKIRSNSQALRNINDGISVTSIADGAMQETDNLLIRMRELTVQSMNGTLNSDDRKDINLELASLQSQIDTVANSTEFNGISLLGQSRQSIAIQTGTGSSDTVDIVLKGTRALDLGSGGSETIRGGLHATAGLANSIAGVMSINGVMVNTVNDGGSTAFGAGSAASLANAISSLGITNLSATATSGSISLGVPSAKTVVTTVTNPITHVTTSTTTITPVTVQGGNLVINGHDIAFNWNAGMGTSLTTVILDAINNSNCGVSASNNGGILLESTNPGNGYNIQVQSNGTNNQSVFSGFDLKQSQDLTEIGSITMTSERAFTIEGGLNGASQGWSIAPGTFCSLTTLESIDLALNQVSEYRANVGSTQNRLESEARNMQNQYENLNNAQSRIMDADVAQETTEMMKNNLLKQASLAVLAQANQMPSLALSLLRQL
jgi:flagellin